MALFKQNTLLLFSNDSDFEMIQLTSGTFRIAPGVKTDRLQSAIGVFKRHFKQFTGPGDAQVSQSTLDVLFIEIAT